MIEPISYSLPLSSGQWPKIRSEEEKNRKRLLCRKKITSAATRSRVQDIIASDPSEDALILRKMLQL